MAWTSATATSSRWTALAALVVLVWLAGRIYANAVLHTGSCLPLVAARRRTGRRVG